VIVLRSKYYSEDQVILHQPAYEDGTKCSETSAYKIQTPGNYPEEIKLVKRKEMGGAFGVHVGEERRGEVHTWFW